MVPVCKLVEKLDLDQMLLLQTCEVGTTGTYHLSSQVD